MSTNTLPNQILIIRHGEKVGDPKKDDDGGRHLSVRGSARAAALPSLFSQAIPQLSCKFHAHNKGFVGEYRQIPSKGTAPRFPTPNHIFATEKSKSSNRPLETILPLATALNLPVCDSLKDDDAGIKKLVNAVLNEFPGQIVLICWHHGKIPEIAKALGIAKPPKWDGKLFDRVWEITFPKGKAALKDLPQMLLYGDSAK